MSKSPAVSPPLGDLKYRPNSLIIFILVKALLSEHGRHLVHHLVYNKSPPAWTPAASLAALSELSGGSACLRLIIGSAEDVIDNAPTNLTDHAVERPPQSTRGHTGLNTPAFLSRVARRRINVAFFPDVRAPRLRQCSMGHKPLRGTECAAIMYLMDVAKWLWLVIKGLRLVAKGFN